MMMMMMMVEVGDHNDDGYGGGDGDHDPDDDDADDDDDDGEDYDGDDGHDDGDGDDDDDDDDDECNCVYYYYLQYYCSRMPTISGIHPSYMEHRDAHSGGQKEQILSSLPFWSHISKNHLSSTVFKAASGTICRNFSKTHDKNQVLLQSFPEKTPFKK